MHHLWHGVGVIMYQITLMGKIHDNLSVILAKKQTETLAKYDDYIKERHGIIEYEIFAYAFRLGFN